MFDPVVRKRRLDRLKVVLANVAKSKAKDQFDMNQWFHSCGTPSCAAGWATVDRVLSAEGLTKGMVGTGHNTCNNLAQFFGISYQSSRRIFLSHNYAEDDVTPADVIKRIEQIQACYA